MSHKGEKSMVNLTIDGQQVQVEQGQTIIAAAEKLGIKIPTMCYLKKVSTTGACRVCLVDVEGVGAPVTACNTVATEGIVVTTTGEELVKKRKDMIRLMLVNHPLDCPVCDAAGECDLQDICFEHGILDQPFTAEDVAAGKITDWPLIENVPSRCVLCEKCVKVGHELTGIGDFTVVERGDMAYIGRKPGNDIDPYIEGNAVEVCPVGAMISKPFKHSARSWTLDKVPSIGFAGGSLEQVDLNVKQDKLFRITSQDDTTINNGLLGFDSSFGYGFVNSDKRLLSASVNGEEVAMADALKIVAAKVAELGGSAVAGLSSARLTVEENFLFQKLFRTAFKSNNIDSEARFGMLRASETLNQVLGLRGASAAAEQIAGADAVLVFGSDITSEQPQINYLIQKAYRQNDASLLVANMRKVRIAKESHCFLNYAPGSEVALASALTKLIVDNGQADEAFLKQYVKNSADVKKALAKVDVTKTAEVCGVDAALIVEVAERLGSAENVAIVFGGDVTKSANCEETVKALANLAMVSGALGCESGGLYPVDEKPNMQGLLDAGVAAEYLPGYVACTEAGMTAQQILEGIESGAVKMLYVAGTNPLVSYPESARWKAALEKVELLVVQDILASELTEMANVVLPAAAYSEKSGTYIACDHRAGVLTKAVAPKGASQSDKAIFAQLLETVTGKTQTLCNEKILAEMAGSCELFSAVGLTGGRYLASCSKKAYAPAAAALTFSDCGDGAAANGLTLIAGKMHAHTGVTSTYAAGALEIAPEGYIEISSGDADNLGVSDGAVVTVKSAQGTAQGKARVSSYLPQGVLFAPYHFAELNIQQIMPTGANYTSVELTK
jgi:formate dehydrogenase alpha subunit